MKTFHLCILGLFALAWNTIVQAEPLSIAPLTRFETDNRLNQNAEVTGFDSEFVILVEPPEASYASAWMTNRVRSAIHRISGQRFAPTRLEMQLLKGAGRPRDRNKLQFDEPRIKRTKSVVALNIRW